MPQYKKKPIIIQAEEMTEKNLKNNKNWPAWLKEAWKKPPEDIGAFYICEDDSYEVVTKFGAVEVPIGVMMVRGRDGELYPCEKKLFLENHYLSK